MVEHEPKTAWVTVRQCGMCQFMGWKTVDGKDYCGGCGRLIVNDPRNPDAPTQRTEPRS